MRPDLPSTAQAIAWHARNAPETIAVVENGTSVCYRSMAAELVRCVGALRGFGVGAGMLVGIQTRERYLTLLLSLACETIGAATTVLTRGDLADDADIIRHCQMLLVNDAPATPVNGKIVSIPLAWRAGLPPAPDDEATLRALDRDIDPGRIARIVRTSGTTGRRKAMPMSHATQQLRVDRTIERVAHDILPNPRLLCLYGLGVGTVYVRVLGVLRHGGTVWFAAAEHVSDLIAAGAVNYATFALGDIERTVLRAGRPPAGHKMHVEVFGATVPRDLRQQIRDRLNAAVTNKYSSNETNPVAIVDDDGVGTVLPGVDVRIVDESGHEQPPGAPGIIRVRTAAMIHGYFNDPVLTEATFIDGWFHTGDIGTVPEPGKLVLLGRADDMLNIGGRKVAPAPIEARIKVIAGVADAAVVSVTNAFGIAVLLAAVEIAAGRPPADLEHSVGAVLGDYVGAYEIMPVRRLPRTATGKLQRHAIEAVFHQTRAA